MKSKLNKKIFFKGAGSGDSEFAPLTNAKGLNVISAAIFIAGEMAGSGILALPRAAVDAGKNAVLIFSSCKFSVDSLENIHLYILYI